MDTDPLAGSCPRTNETRYHSDNQRRVPLRDCLHFLATQWYLNPDGRGGTRAAMGIVTVSNPTGRRIDTVVIRMVSDSLTANDDTECPQVGTAPVLACPVSGPADWNRLPLVACVVDFTKRLPGVTDCQTRYFSSLSSGCVIDHAV